MDDPFSELAPDPTGLSAVPLVYASWFRRVIGGVIDLCVMSAVTTPFMIDQVLRILDGSATAADGRYVTLVSLIVQISYWTGFHGWRGSTIGKMAMRTVVRRVDGSPIDFNVAFVRAVTLSAINFVGSFLILVPTIANAIRPLWHPQRQAWHDQVARTVVLSLTRPSRA